MKAIFSYIRSVFVRRTKNTPTLLELMQLFRHKKIVEEKLSKSTRQKYHQIINNITRFLSENGLIYMLPRDFNIKIGYDLVTWLHENLDTCSRSHSTRHVEFCKRVLDYAVRMEYLDHNPLLSIEVRRDPVKEVIHLDQDEIDRLYGFEFISDKLNRVRDLYIFQCHTGLSYADLHSYRHTKDKDGTEWLYNCRTKGENDRPYWVPLFPIAKILYEKYNGQLPRFVNGTYNRLLKEIAPLLSINKHLTTHTARKTFATLKNEMGYSTESIKDMLGHKSIRTTETHYIRVNRKRVLKEARIFEKGFLPPAA